MDLLKRITLEHIEELEAKKEVDKSKLKRYYLIFELLKNDNCFFEISKEDAFQILSHLGIENPVKYYRKLISPESYSRIRKENRET